jgi:dienelactone hydrolase
MRTSLRGALLALALALVFPGGALAATKAGQPFPSNLYTVPDATQVTHLRVDLPKPDCAARPSDCADVAVLNTLDGFNVQPRISVPFSGPIDLATATSENIFLVGPRGKRIGINQVEWEPAANALHFESNEQLAQDATYLLVVTRGVHAADGSPLAGNALGELRANSPYKQALHDALPMAMAGGAEPGDVAAASVFTTQSITATSKKIRGQLHATPVSFALGSNGERTVFPLSQVAGIQWKRQVGTSTYATSFLPTPALSIHLGSIETVAFGSYASPDYENGAEVIPATGTLTGTPAPTRTNTLEFSLYLPSGAMPAGGWPVVLVGHGFTDSKNGMPMVVASSLAHAGLASIAINVVGHGGGAGGTYTVLRSTAAPVTLADGGRGIDQDGNGTIDSTEGVSAVGAQSLIGNRDGLRQTTIDLMQLVKEIEAGIDVDGDGTPDLSTSRIYYTGQSFGGIYGVQLLGLEPDIRAGVPNVPGGSIIEVARLGGFRFLIGLALLGRTPSLYNAPPNASFTSFDENMPLRNEPTRVDTVPGASAIQTVFDNTEWAQQAANPAAYAPYLTSPVIIQFARGDKTVPNPTTSAILRACGCADRATLYRNDLAYAANPAVGKNPHTFLTNVGGAGTTYALEAQNQIATFLASDGSTTIDPDRAGAIFETPTSIVPEDLAYIP